jgi:hypothetical protein
MAKLKPDYIEWVLTLNASDAQKEIHNLSEKNKELRDSNKEIKKALNSECRKLRAKVRYLSGKQSSTERK